VTTVKDVLDQKVEMFTPFRLMLPCMKLSSCMAEKNIASLVVSGRWQAIGIMSERLYAREIVLKRQDLCGDCCSADHVDQGALRRPNQSVQECMAVMAAKGVRHLPVLQNESWWYRFDWRSGEKRHR